MSVFTFDEPEKLLTDRSVVKVGNDYYRAEIVQQDDADRPDRDMDTVIFITSVNRPHEVDDELVDLIMGTDAWEATMELCRASGTVPPNLYDRDVREHWLEAIRDKVLARQVRAGYNGHYVVHTTPERCATLGVDWADAEKAMEGEIELLVMWAENDIYGYTIDKANTCDHCKRTDWEEVDSCWGFYGDDIDKNGMIGNLPSDMHAVLRAAEWFRRS